MHFWQSYEIPQRSLSQRVMSSSSTNFSELISISYVEKLLKDMEWLTNGVQELYQRLRDLDGWAGPLPANLVSGRPHVHSILNGLGILTSNEEEENPANHKRDAILHKPRNTTMLEGDTNLYTLNVAHMILPPETPLNRACRQPAAANPTRSKALNPYPVFTGSAPLPVPLTDTFLSSVQIATQGTIQQDDDQVFSPLKQGETLDDVQAFNSAAIQTEEYYDFLHMPGSSDSYLSPTWVQTPTEQYDVRVQQAPLYPQQSSTTQVGKQLDYFSLEREHSTDVSSAMEIFADFDNMLERRLLSWGEIESDNEAPCT
jgi:hypothetical protein